MARAVECRRFLNEHLGELPAQAQNYMYKALHERWQSAFFELTVASVLRELGADVTVEATSTTEGRRPDFYAAFSDGSVLVEAVSPVFDAPVKRHRRDHIPLLDFVESNAPAGWSVGALQLPDIGPNDPQREFKAAVRDMLSGLSGRPRDSQRVLRREISTGTIELAVLPACDDGLLCEPGMGLVDDSEARIRQAVRRKRRQVRGAAAPVILAIQASGVCSRFEHFDSALYGCRCDYHDRRNTHVACGFEPKGLFANRRDSSPTYAGVLAFLYVGFKRGVQPVLYHHPRFRGALPRGFATLEHRRLEWSPRGIVVEPAVVDDLMERLHPVQV